MRSLTYIGVGPIALRIHRLDPSASSGLRKRPRAELNLPSVSINHGGEWRISFWSMGISHSGPRKLWRSRGGETQLCVAYFQARFPAAAQARRAAATAVAAASEGAISLQRASGSVLPVDARRMCRTTRTLRLGDPGPAGRSLRVSAGGRAANPAPGTPS